MYMREDTFPATNFNPKTSSMNAATDVPMSKFYSSLELLKSLLKENRLERDENSFACIRRILKKLLSFDDNIAKISS